jgi:hypothetical protein|tara:strand:+ start:4748 stop:5176 length:429 start_codon:yes stop_codon:yes gene_type:complete
MRFLTLLFFSIILLISCSKSEKISIILKDSQCGTVAQKQHIVVDGDEEWDALYKNLLQTNPLNNLSDQELGVFIFLGERSSSGYSLDFIESYTADKEFIIVVNEIGPKELDPVLTVMTYPCIALKIPKTDKEIKIIFKESRE